MKQMETTLLFFAFVFSLAACWHFVGAAMRSGGGPSLFHVRTIGGGVVYQDYWTTNPPVSRQDKPWFETLTNYPGR